MPTANILKYDKNKNLEVHTNHHEFFISGFGVSLNEANEFLTTHNLTEETFLEDSQFIASECISGNICFASIEGNQLYYIPSFNPMLVDDIPSRENLFNQLVSSLREFFFDDFEEYSSEKQYHINQLLETFTINHLGNIEFSQYS